VPKTKIIKVKQVNLKAPGPIRILCGSVAAYWLSGIINPGFVAIAVMLLLFFPVFFLDFLFPQPPSKPLEAQNETEEIIEEEPLE
jgi:hypothetical protein